MGSPPVVESPCEKVRSQSIQIPFCHWQVVSDADCADTEMGKCPHCPPEERTAVGEEIRREIALIVLAPALSPLKTGR
jgi:hypothetical protein